MGRELPGLLCFIVVRSTFLVKMFKCCTFLVETFKCRTFFVETFKCHTFIVETFKCHTFSWGERGKGMSKITGMDPSTTPWGISGVCIVPPPPQQRALKNKYRQQRSFFDLRQFSFFFF